MSTLGAPPFQLLEINLISAQDLAPVTKTMRAYAVMWLHPERKLTTQVDQNGQTNPSWNEKFVFRVDEDFLNEETSVIMIEIYTSTWMKDVLVGTVGVLVSNLLPPSINNNNKSNKMRFVALQIRRPSGRPQGILNVGVALLDSTMRSMPLYSEMSASAVGYWDIMDSKKQKPNLTPLHKKSYSDDKPKVINSKIMMLQRSNSDMTDLSYNQYGGKGESMLSASYLNDESMVNEESELGIGIGLGLGLPPPPPHKLGGHVNLNGSLCSDVGPSPSVVAAAIAKGLYPIPGSSDHEMGSSVLEDWTEESSGEGLKTKIDRWRTELPPIYDHLEYKKLASSNRRTGQTPKVRPKRRGNGLFSCFGTAYGCEFSVSCGGGNHKKKFGNGKSVSPSELTFDESYL